MKPRATGRPLPLQVPTAFVRVRPRGAFYAFPNIGAYIGKRAGNTQITDAVSMLRTCPTIPSSYAGMGSESTIARLNLVRLPPGSTRVTSMPKGASSMAADS